MMSETEAKIRKEVAEKHKVIQGYDFLAWFENQNYKKKYYFDVFHALATDDENYMLYFDYFESYIPDEDLEYKIAEAFDQNNEKMIKFLSEKGVITEEKLEENSPDYQQRLLNVRSNFFLDGFKIAEEDMSLGHLILKELLDSSREENLVEYYKTAKKFGLVFNDEEKQAINEEITELKFELEEWESLLQ